MAHGVSYSNYRLLTKGNIPLYIGMLSTTSSQRKGRRVGGAGDTGAGSRPCYERRMLLHAALGTGLGLLLTERTRAQDVEPRKARPQEGDHFVFATGDRKGATIMLVDLAIGDPPVTAYPADPHTGVVRMDHVSIRYSSSISIRQNSPRLLACTRHRGSWRTRRSVRMKAVMYGCGRERGRR